MRVVHCSGTAYEMGKQIGEACGDVLSKSIDTTLGILSRGHQTTVEDVIRTASKFIEPVRQYDPLIIDQLQGQADALNIPFEKMFTLRCVFEMSYYYKQIQGLCTSIAVTGKATADGKTILAQNIDWLNSYEPYLLHMHYEDGTRILALSLSGMVEYSLSSNGFGNCANSLFTKGDHYRFSLPLGCYLTKVMRQSSVNDAMNLLKEVARGVGYFHLADNKGAMFGIESTFEDVEVISPINDVLSHSNCYCTERFQQEDLAPIILPDALLRRERVSALIKEAFGNITIDTVKGILTDHGNPPYSICRHSDIEKPAAWEMTTVASFIMLPEDGVMYITKGSPCENTYVKYIV